MDYLSLPPTYRTAQADRVYDNARRIIARDRGPTAGRAVPDDESLVIGTGRALQLAVLFLDISGFSDRPSGNAHEQHDLLQVLNIFFSEMVRIAGDYGGVVEKNTGDGLMAYFDDSGGGGAPVAGHHALAAALTMMHANERVVSPVLAAMGHEPVAFRIGIDYGAVTVARVGPARMFNANVAIGCAANIANKILAKAAPGEIVIGEKVALQLPANWDQYVIPRGPSGFEYVQSGEPYPLYVYSGRWT